MAIIDSNNFIAHLVWSGLVDKATCGELKKAIELCTIKDVYTKNEVVDILLDIKMKLNEIVKVEEQIDKTWASGLRYSEKIIQQKINALKEKDNDK